MIIIMIKYVNGNGGDDVGFLAMFFSSLNSTSYTRHLRGERVARASHDAAVGTT